MQIRGASSPAGAEPLGQHSHDLAKRLETEIAVRVGLSNQGKKLALLPFLGPHHGDYLLGQHIERLFGDHQSIELAALGCIYQTGALHQLVPAEGKQTSFGSGSDRMTGTTDPLRNAAIDRVEPS